MPKENELVIERVFAAPREYVWQAWTDSEMMKKWWGPKDFTAPSINIDFRVGGKYLFCMHGSPRPGEVAKDFWSTGIYKEIVPLEKIVATDSFADEKGNVVPTSYYDMPGKWPMELEVTVMFEKMGDNKTKMTLRHVGIPAGENLEGARMGWSQSFDKLEELLKK